MLSSATKVFLGLVITLDVAAGVVAIGDARYGDAGGSLAQACGGLPATRLKD